MRSFIGFAIIVAPLAACTGSPSNKPLPSATNTPHLANAQQSDVACGADVAYYGNPSPDLSYRYAYDADGRMVHADGVWAYDGTTDTIDYTWAGDNFTHMLWTSGWDDSEYEIGANYDAANNLLDYTYSWTDGTNTEAWNYAFSNFVGANQPTRELITMVGDPTTYGYDLVYDADGRLTEAVPDAGPSTTWTYDDVALTVAVNYDNGAWTELMTYDADFKPLTSEWGGSDPSAIAGDETYAWTGDRLDSVVYRSASETAPQQIELVETDTMLYNCPIARTAGGRKARLPRPFRP